MMMMRHNLFDAILIDGGFSHHRFLRLQHGDNFNIDALVQALRKWIDTLSAHPPLNYVALRKMVEQIDEELDRILGAANLKNEFL